MHSLFSLQKSDHEMRSYSDHIKLKRNMETGKKKVAKEYIILNESLGNKMKKERKKIPKISEK